jgi:predicted nucleic acid-binding protein
MDVIIAQVCLHHKVSLFTLDKHFRSIAELEVFEPIIYYQGLMKQLANL